MPSIQTGMDAMIAAALAGLDAAKKETRRAKKTTDKRYKPVRGKRGFFKDSASDTGYSYSNARGRVKSDVKAPKRHNKVIGEKGKRATLAKFLAAGGLGNVELGGAPFTAPATLAWDRPELGGEVVTANPFLALEIAWHNAQRRQYGDLHGDEPAVPFRMTVDPSHKPWRHVVRDQSGPALVRRYGDWVDKNDDDIRSSIADYFSTRYTQARDNYMTVADAQRAWLDSELAKWK